MKAIKKGSRIGIVTLTSAVEPQRLAQALSIVEQYGYEPVMPFDASTNYGRYEFGFSCASAQTRAQGFMDLICDDSVDAIILARGGYSAWQTLPLLDYQKISQAKKLIVGFSDITALLGAVLAQSKIPAVHGPTISRFADVTEKIEARESIEALFSLLSDPSYRVTLSGPELRSGEAEGRLIAGNLSILVSLLGTPWDFNYDGAILVAEDLKEPAYRVHRALSQLKYAGKLKRLAGFCFGQFTEAGVPRGPSLDDVINGSVEDIFSETSYPVLRNLPVGHVDKNFPLALSCKAQIKNGELLTLESPLAY